MTAFKIGIIDEIYLPNYPVPLNISCVVSHGRSGIPISFVVRHTSRRRRYCAHLVYMCVYKYNVCGPYQLVSDDVCVCVFR